MLGAIPVVGAGASALMGDDAMAAVPVLGEADSVGESSEDEAQLLAEIKAQKDYSNSPSRMDRLKSLIGRSPANVEQAQEEIKKALPLPNFSGDVSPEKFDEERNIKIEERRKLERLLGKQR